MKFMKTAMALSLVPFVAACATKWDVESAKSAPNSGSAFQKELQSEYSRLAMLERDEADWADTGLFIDKAIASTQGEVAPQMIDERRLPENKVGELRVALNTLNDAFSKGGKTAAPQAAARAQAGYDCWMQEQEENFQPEDIEACKKYFEAGLRDMYAALDGEPKMGKAMMDSVIVYFDFDSAYLDGQSRLTIAKAAEMAMKADAVMVNGHTDTAGANAYNESLALDRATAVANLLKEKGVAAKSIRVGASGESANAVATGDDVRESRNRRVEIIFK